MKQPVVAVVLTVVLFTAVTQGVTVIVTGAGTKYKLQLEQDVFMESGLNNHNSLSWLVVAKHPGYPNKRSLVQFEDLPSNACPSAKVKFAKMYVYFVYAHKASGSSVNDIPYIPRHVQIHLVKKPWREDQATSTRRLSGVSWTTPYLGLDGIDAEASTQCGTVTIFTGRPAGFVEFDITDAVKSWKSGAEPNNGLLIRATNELENGRDIRFYSKSFEDASKHAFVNVLCA